VHDLRTYYQREVKIRELVAPAIDVLERQRSGLRVSDPGGGSLTWADLDERLSELIAELDDAISRDDLQDVGRRAHTSCSATARAWPATRHAADGSRSRRSRWRTSCARWLASTP
jgi:hypothetical protein